MQKRTLGNLNGPEGSFSFYAFSIAADSDR